MVGAKTKVILGLIKSGKTKEEAVTTVFVPSSSVQSSQPIIQPTSYQPPAVGSSMTGEQAYQQGYVTTPPPSTTPTQSTTPLTPTASIPSSTFVGPMVQTPEQLHQRLILGSQFSKTKLSKGVYTASEYAQKMMEEQQKWDVEYQRRQQIGSLDNEFIEQYGQVQIQATQALNLPPSATVKRTGEGYLISENIDYKAWKKEQWEKQPNAFIRGAQAISGSFLNIFDEKYWGALVTGKGSEYLYEKEYNIQKQVKSGDFLGAWANVQLPAYENVIIPMVAGMGVGKVLGYSTGYLTQIGRIGTAKAINIGAGAVGIGLGGYGTYDIGKTFYEGNFELGISKSIGFGMQMGVGYTSFKSGQGTGYVKGATKGYKKFISTEYEKGNIDATIYNEAMKALRSGSYLEKEMMSFKIKQPKPEFKTVQAFEKQTGLKGYMEKKLLDVKHQIFGGLASEKPSTHDVDVMLSGRSRAAMKYASKSLKAGEVERYADIKPFQKTGEIVGEFTIKQSPVKIEGYTVQKWTEQFSRLRGQALRPAHAGRVKDIPESVRMLEKIYAGKKISPETIKTIASYKESMSFFETLGEKNPLISSMKRTESIYGPSLKQRMYESSTRFWEKVIPESFKKADVLRYTRKPFKETGLEIGYTPPSPSLKPSVYAGFLGGLSSSYLVKKGISPSVSIKPSISRYYKPSVSKILSGSKKPSPPSPYKYIPSSIPSPPLPSPPPPSVSPSLPSPPPPSVSPPPPSPSKSKYPSYYYKSPTYPSTPPPSPSFSLYGRGYIGGNINKIGFKYAFRKAKMGLPFDTKLGDKLVKKIQKVNIKT